MKHNYIIHSISFTLTNMNTENQEMIIVTSIYFLIGLIIAIMFNLLKPTPIKRWQMDGMPVIPTYPHLHDSMDALILAPKMKKWIEKIDNMQVDIRSIWVSDINWFSKTPDPKKLGFVKFSVNASDKSTGKPIASNIVFLRGDSVAIFIVVKVMSPITRRSKQYVLLCEQMRVASGQRRKEICAGMMDDEGNIASVVLKEVKEETGFNIKHKDELIELGSIYPSPGACDEEIFLYAWTTTITEEEFEEKQRRLFGNAAEVEEINLSFVPIKEMNNVLGEMKDVKAECAFRRYMNSK